MENKFKEVMSNNSYKKLQEIINNPNDFQPEAVSAAKTESENRNIEFENLYKKGLENLSDIEFVNIIKNEDYYPDELIDKINSTRADIISPEKEIKIKSYSKVHSPFMANFIGILLGGLLGSIALLIVRIIEKAGGFSNKVFEMAIFAVFFYSVWKSYYNKNKSKIEENNSIEVTGEVRIVGKEKLIVYNKLHESSGILSELNQGQNIYLI